MLLVSTKVQLAVVGRRPASPTGSYTAGLEGHLVVSEDALSGMKGVGCSFPASTAFAADPKTKAEAFLHFLGVDFLAPSVAGWLFFDLPEQLQPCSVRTSTGEGHVAGTVRQGPGGAGRQVDLPCKNPHSKPASYLSPDCCTLIWPCTQRVLGGGDVATSPLLLAPACQYRLAPPPVGGHLLERLDCEQ